ncbi:conserved protein of unknown function [Petrocella atlantisensis]|uniref:Glycosyl transferase n=1 Tax=Petrocella atlantisensis TaxID=2173034 RepID=A0A3P7RTD5_9FIRM|nr:ATP-grasp fold amidoligase family protein [Petrocella atlantisensis]VDN46166.1 conserved protein of unknown function [Petrocella atlantisensis]
MKKIIKKIILEHETNKYIYESIKETYSKYCMTDEQLVKKKFRKHLEREVILDAPVKYNDKLQWLKLYWRDSKATLCADKYEVRKIIENTIGAQYLNELIAVYDKVEDIDINQLPDSFVLKGTHGSGFNIICKDKKELDWPKAQKIMRHWLKRNYHWTKREWVYKDIKPRIVCEKYLEEMDVGELRDYKIFCFNGEPKVIEVDFDRFVAHKRNIYDLDWNLLEGEIKYPRDPHYIIEKPDKLKEMLDLSRILAQGFPHVRVDFYIVEDRLYFGELTFFHESGTGAFRPEAFEIEMGNWIELPTRNN